MSILIPNQNRISSLRFGLLITWILFALALYQYNNQVIEEGFLAVSNRIEITLFVGYFMVLLLFISVVFSWTSFGDQILSLFEKIAEFSQRFKIISTPLFLIALLIFPVLVMSYYGAFLENTFPRLLVFWTLIVLGTELLRLKRNKLSWLARLSISSLLFAFIYRLALLTPDISTNPLSLTWSEGSFFYKASLFFADQVYGMKLPLPVLHPSRNMLQAIPFMVDGLPILAHRLWQVFLWVSLTSLSAVLLGKRLDIKPRPFLLFFTFWVFLFFWQGAVFYHLLISFSIVIWGFDRNNYWKSVGIIILASLWAGISRVNWIPIPGLMGATLYLLETPVNLKLSSNPLKYLTQPISYFLIGSLFGLSSYFTYIFASGNQETKVFSTSFTSDLLWYRLFPNPTFPMGILFGILIVSAPLLVLIVLSIKKNPHIWHWIRILSLSAILTVLLLGGLIVSIKIGGGTNLHNLDAYMVILVVSGSYLYFNRFEIDRGKTQRLTENPLGWLTILALWVPVLFNVLAGGRFISQDLHQSQETVDEIRLAVAERSAGGGEVLFISERQLLAFGSLENIPLVPEYEKNILIEMAMADNQPYLNDFHHDIQIHRFELIITDPLVDRIRFKSFHSLAEENNYWVRQVVRPILCSYLPLEAFVELEVQVLVPLGENSCK